MVVKRKKSILIIVILLILIGIMLLFAYYNASKKSPVERLLNDAGVFMQPPPKGYGKEFGEKIMNLLVTKEEIKKITTPTAKPQPTSATLWDWGKEGKILSYDKNLDLTTGSTINIGIERPEDMKLRHKIVIGTDRSSWELIRKEKNLSENKTFKRTYLLIQRRGENGRISGLIFYEGMKVEIEIEGQVSDDVIKNLEDVTWLVSGRIENIYNRYIKEISEGSLFKNNPTMTRPDLPDPDKQHTQGFPNHNIFNFI